MTDDAELLRRYATDRSEPAFAELVRRHLGFVYHAALRQCGGDAHRAEDVAQAVFTDLARKAHDLADRPVLAGWLYTSTRFAAAQAVRGEARRQTRERAAAMIPDEPPANWERLQPVIDDALAALGEPEREAVLLRFFEGRPFAEVGARLAVSEDAARRRVERALEKMREPLARHGVTSTVTALAAALAGQAGAAAPAGLAAQIVETAVGPAVAAAITFMSLSKIQIGAALAVLAAGASDLVWQHHVNRQLSAQVAQLEGAARENTRLRVEHAQLQSALAAARRPAAEAEPAEPRAGRSEPATASVSKEASTVPLAAGLTPVLNLGNAGRATPQAAFTTQLWAARTGNVELEATALTFSPEGRAKLQALLASLPADLAATYDTPEKLMAFALAGSPHPIGGMQIRGETPAGTDDVILHTAWQHADDTIVHESDVHLVHSAEGWRMVVPVSLVDRAVAYLSRRAAAPPGR